MLRVQYRLQIVYRDPFHDFTLVRALDENGEIPDLPEDILLRPNEAQPGREIRIVGNDSGLRSNIGQGYIGRTDANPPRFTEHPMAFQGFNTEYITVSMTINGGASGSMAFNNKGEAVALVCARFGSISYLLPLDLPLKALRCLQQNKHVTRGTLQIQWELQPLHECKRLGLAMEWIARLDDAQAEYAVCAKVVLPDGPTDGKIATGDILLEIDGNLVTSMLQVELYMDDHVGKLTGLKLWRHNECLEVECNIQDLHEMTPHHLVRRWGTVFHNMPFTVAMDRNIPV